MLLSISLGFIFTIVVLNKENLFGSNNYTIYVLSGGEFTSREMAYDKQSKLNTGIIVEEDNLYKIYLALYKDLDLVNKMLNYYEDEDINVYINTINVDRSFYNTLNNYEEVIKNSDSSLVFKPVNESILNLYLESIAI